jgi:CHAT domain-containing protein/tetratricopeptide (TPR) repeat protein
MTTLILAAVLVLGSSPAPDDPSDCFALLPTTQAENLPVSDLQEAHQMWSTDPAVSPDTLRRAITQIRKGRRCLLDLDRSSASTSYLREIVLSYQWETYHHTALRQFDAAFRTFEEALALLADPPADRKSLDANGGEEKADLYQDRGYLHYILGDLPASIRNYLNAYNATPASATGDRVEHLLNVGILHQRTQDYASARYYYRRADRLLREASPSDVEAHAQRRARTFSYHANLLLEKTLNTEFDRAALRRARDWARKGRAAAEQGTDRYGWVSLTLSESLGYLGEFDEAYRLNEQVRAYARADKKLEIQSFALYKLGVLHLQTERWARADTVLHDALRMIRNLGNLDRERRVLRDLGRLYELQGKWSRAEHYYRQGIDVIEEYRASLTAFGQWQDPYRGLVRVLLAQNRPEDALEALDRTRARHLRDLRTQSRLSSELPNERRARFDSLTQALTEVRTRLGRADAVPEHTETELRNREAKLMAARRQLLQVGSAATRPSLEAVADTLRARDRALVSYFLDDPWPIYDRAPRSTAFVLNGDSVRSVALPGLTKDSVRTHVDAISPLFREGEQGSRPNTLHFDLAPLHTLYETVYAPVAETLPDDRSLTVIPDGSLFRLPFSMLVRSMPGGRFAPAEARYVVHERATSVALATSLVANTTDAPAWSSFEPTVAAHGVADYATAPADTAQPPLSTVRSVGPDASLSSPSQMPSLPGVERELRALQNTVADVRVALNDEATESRLRHDVRRAGVLHVASHAVVRPSAPFQNALLLHPDSSSDGESTDGVLFLHELRGRTDIPLVVLSACNTARGPIRGGEGMEGLQYAFRAMGTRSTLSTLWAVSDDASVDLTTSFYRHLRAGVSKDRALRRARLDYLQAHPEQASPFFWAGPVLYGSTAPVPLEAPSVFAAHSAWLWGGLTVLGVLGLSLGLLWRRRNRLPEPFCGVGRPA